MVIEQEVTLERQAFEAELTVANGLLVPLQDFQVTVWVRESGSSQYLTIATVDGLEFFRNRDTDEIFFFNPQDEVEPVEIPSDSEKTFTYLMIPTQEAALNTKGTYYEIGADISYKTGSEPITFSVEPDEILVKPQPALSLEYFLPKSVISDDPNTNTVEKAEPFQLGLRVINSGFGAARNLQVESFQPRIEENESGLLIEFRILSSEVNGAGVQPSLTVNFGEVLAGHAETASWRMLSTLFGRFLEAKATFTHSDELGGSITSLIERAKVFRLVGQVQANADSIPDFLSVGSGSSEAAVNGPAKANPEDFELDLRAAPFLTLHPSGLQGDGSQGTITMANVINFSANTEIVQNGNEIAVSIVNPPQQGQTSFSFLRIVDSNSNRRALSSVVRTDGVVLKPENFRLVTEIKEDDRGGIDGFEYFIDIFDIGNAGGNLGYKIYLGDVLEQNEAPFIVPLPDLIVEAGDSVNLTVEAIDPNGDAVELSTLQSNLPVEASFVDNGDNTATFSWPIAKKGLLPLTIFASDGALSATDLVTMTVVDSEDVLSDWLALYGLELNATTLNSDTDGDGLNTLMEYVLNLNPLEISLQGLPQVRVKEVGGIAYLEFECDVLNSVWEARDEVSFPISLSVIVSEDSTRDPADWDELALSPVAESSPIPGMTRIRWLDDTALSDFPEGRFIRLKVTYDDSNFPTP